MPGWQITLIAAIAAILAAATAVLPGRATPPGGTPQRQPSDPTTHPKPGTPTLLNRLPQSCARMTVLRRKGLSPFVGQTPQKS